jgi:hypothetical protein
VRFNIPLLPIQLDARWRPLRAFRFSLRGMMLVVAITAVFFSLWIWFQAYQMQLAHVNNYHAEQAFDPSIPGVIDRPWHARKYNEYDAALERNNMIARVVFVGLALFILVAIIGRMMDWLYRRWRRQHESVL